MTATDPALDQRVAAILTEWRHLARSGIHAAVRARESGDAFGASLIAARREVRLAAIELLDRAIDVTATAKEMHRRAIEHVQREPTSLSGWDASALRYTRARAWQACAQQLDPALPEIHTKWD